MAERSRPVHGRWGDSEDVWVDRERYIRRTNWNTGCGGRGLPSLFLDNAYEVGHRIFILFKLHHETRDFVLHCLLLLSCYDIRLDKFFFPLHTLSTSYVPIQYLA